MKLIFVLLASMLWINCQLKCQTLKWKDILECNPKKIGLDLNQDINCENFFQLSDSCQTNLSIMWDWTSRPKIENMDSVLKCIIYPKVAERYHISGWIIVRFLIDKNGKLYCYEMLSELGQVFNQEAERLIHLFRFSIASISNKPVAYEYVIPIKFPYNQEDKNYKKKKK